MLPWWTWPPSATPTPSTLRLSALVSSCTMPAVIPTSALLSSEPLSSCGTCLSSVEPSRAGWARRRLPPGGRRRWRILSPPATSPKPPEPERDDRAARAYDPPMLLLEKLQGDEQLRCPAHAPWGSSGRPGCITPLAMSTWVGPWRDHHDAGEARPRRFFASSAFFSWSGSSTASNEVIGTSMPADLGWLP